MPLPGNLFVYANVKQNLIYFVRFNTFYITITFIWLKSGQTGPSAHPLVGGEQNGESLCVHVLQHYLMKAH